MNGPTRQHFHLATTGKEVPEPSEAPTTDVFEQRGGAPGTIYKSDGSMERASNCVPDYNGPANKSRA